MAMQSMLPNPSPKRTVSRAALLDLCERARMDAAHAIADALSVQQRAMGVLDATGGIWRELTGEDAPEVEVSARVVRAS